MGRTRSSLIYEYFEYSRMTNKSKCKECQLELSGNKSSNLKSHLKTAHPDSYKTVAREDEKRSCVVKELTVCVDGDQSERLKASDCTIDKFVSKRPRVTLNIGIDELNMACVELVTKNGRPFSTMQDSGFQKIVGPVFKALGSSMNRRKVADLVKEVGADEVKKFKSALKYKLVCLKLDIATRLGRSFLGVNLQYTTVDTLKLCNLVVVELERRHTAETILEALYKVLEDFEISKDQIYSCTTDNGSNFVRALRIHNQNVDDDDEANFDEEDDDSGEDNCNLSAEEIDNLDLDDMDPEQDTLPPVADDVLKNDNEILEDIIITNRIQTMRCAAHTLQLAVSDFLKEPANKNLLLRARKLAKEMRTPNIKYILKPMEKLPPVLDVPTRWSSTHKMLCSLKCIKETSIDLFDQGLIKTKCNALFWSSLDQLVDILEPAQIATTSFQAESLTAGEFHEKWIKMKIQVQKLKYVKAKRFYKYVEKREKILLENDGVLASVYADPRYKNLLTPSQLTKSRETALIVARRLIELQEKSLEEQQMNAETDSDSPTSEAGDEFERMLVRADKSKKRQVAGAGDVERKIASLKEELDQFEQSVRLSERKTNVFKWWHERVDTSDILKNVAKTLLSLPVTRVSVERLFSGLRFILNDLRGNLSHQSVQHIMFVRMNKEF